MPKKGQQVKCFFLYIQQEAIFLWKNSFTLYNSFQNLLVLNWSISLEPLPHLKCIRSAKCGIGMDCHEMLFGLNI